jgi:hypothetical protein
VELPAIEVTASAVPMGMQEFEDRRRGGFGRFIDWTVLRQSEDRRLSDLLDEIPGVSIRHTRSGNPFALRRNCPMTVLLNAGEVLEHDPESGDPIDSRRWKSTGGPGNTGRIRRQPLRHPRTLDPPPVKEFPCAYNPLCRVAVAGSGRPPGAGSPHGCRPRGLVQTGRAGRGDRHPGLEQDRHNRYRGRVHAERARAWPACRAGARHRVPADHAPRLPRHQRHPRRRPPDRQSPGPACPSGSDRVCRPARTRCLRRASPVRWEFVDWTTPDDRNTGAPATCSGNQGSVSYDKYGWPSVEHL